MCAKERLKEEFDLTSEEEAVQEYIGVSSIIGITYSLLADHIQELSRIEKGPILDLGTGFGNLAIEIAKRNPNIKIIGIDISQPILKIAKENVVKERISNIDFRICDLHDLDYSDNSIELITSQGSMHHWRDVKKAMAQIYRVLMPGGLAFICDLRRDSPRDIVNRVAGLLNKNQAKAFINSVDASFLPVEITAILNELSINDFTITEQKFSRKTIIKNLEIIKKSENRSDDYNKLNMNIIIRK